MNPSIFIIGLSINSKHTNAWTNRIDKPQALLASNAPHRLLTMALIAIRPCRSLLLLGQIHALTLQNMEQCLGALQYLHVCCFCLHNGFVILVSGRYFSGERIIDSRETLGKNTKIILDFLLLFLILENLTVHFLPLLLQVLNAWSTNESS